jgi:hypothetical protein
MISPYIRQGWASRRDPVPGLVSLPWPTWAVRPWRAFSAARARVHHGWAVCDLGVYPFSQLHLRAVATAGQSSIVSGASMIVTVVMALPHLHTGGGWRCGRGALQQRGAGRPAEHAYLGRIPGSLNDASEHLA